MSIMSKERQPPPAEKADWSKVKDQSGYSDKGGHKSRSEANQPQHLNHWKKVERKQYGS